MENGTGAVEEVRPAAVVGRRTAAHGDRSSTGDGQLVRGGWRIDPGNLDFRGMARTGTCFEIACGPPPSPVFQCPPSLARTRGALGIPPTPSIFRTFLVGIRSQPRISLHVFSHPKVSVRPIAVRILPGAFPLSRPVDLDATVQDHPTVSYGTRQTGRCPSFDLPGGRRRDLPDRWERQKGQGEGEKGKDPSPLGGGGRRRDGRG